MSGCQSAAWLKAAGWVGAALAVAGLASCGGGGNNQEQVQAAFASAPLAAVAQAQCDSGVAGVQAAGSRCMQVAPQFRPALAKPQAAVSITMEAAFDWAPTAYPTLFRGPYVTAEVAAYNMNFQVRYFPATNTYLGLADGASIYVLGPWTNYQLQYVGELAGLACAVQPASCGGTAPTVMQQVSTFLAGYDAFISSMPADGAASNSFNDACYLDNGESTAWNVSHFDESLTLRQGSFQYRVGSQRSNVEILAIRDTTNANSTGRREVDIRYHIAYAEGTTVTSARQTLVMGSTYGTCATPDNHSAFRFLGNQRIVGTFLRARNTRNERYQLATGAPDATTPLAYRREIQLGLYDPRGVATYAIVTGPGPTVSVNSIVTPFSMKLVSPRVLSTTAELWGKANNYANWGATDFFRACRATATVGGGVPVATVANCAGEGAQGYSWGWTLSNPNAGNLAAADSGFAGQGWVAGGVYTFAVYADDGWKTVNGQLGKTPIAIYSTTLDALPYTFAQMYNGGQDLFPRIGSQSMQPPAISFLLNAGGAASFTASWAAPGPFPDARVFGLQDTYEYFEGPAAGNGQGVAFPAYRYSMPAYPEAGTTAGTFTISARPPELLRKSIYEYGVEYSDRGVRRILDYVSFF